MRADSSSLSSWWMEGAASCCAVLVDFCCVDDDCFGELEVAVNAAEAAPDTATDTATELHKWAAVKSPLGAQTVLVDRHDLIYEILLQEPSAACGTRPRELSNGWARKRDGSEKRSSENLIRQRGQRNNLSPSGESVSCTAVK